MKHPYVSILSFLFLCLFTLSSFTVNAGPGDTCGEATSITEGTHTATALVGTGAIFTNAVAAKWYTYTPAVDGLLNVNSCGNGVDTRLAVLTGDCMDIPGMTVEATNDDFCDLGDGTLYASQVELLVSGGTTYFIYWDDRWSANGFDFDVTLGAVPIVDVTLTVDMANETVSGEGVFVSGEFNGFPDPGMALADNGDGTWSGTVTGVTAGDTIEYIFQNGTGGGESGLDASCTLGIVGNRYFVAGLENSSEPTVCFNLCGPCSLPDPTCDEPTIVISDDIESYPAGDIDGQAGHWSIWPGAASSGVVSTDFAASGTQSVKIDGNVAGMDALYLLGDPVGGHYLVEWKMYIPSGNTGYFNLQHEMPTTSAGFWAIEVWFQNDGEIRFLNSDTGEEIFDTYPPDEWFDVQLFIDIDSDEARMIIGDVTAAATTVVAWTFSDATSSGLNSINFYPADATYIYYVDDVGMSFLPTAGPGQYCYTAETIDVGTHTVPELECFGAAYFINDEGYAGYWFEYTPTEDGYITVSSCGGGADSRAWIFDGDCHSLRTQGINDDRCDIGTGDEWASYREAPVTAGMTYYIMWDDMWETTGFDFELTHTAGALTDGNFCQSAIAINAGVDIFTETFGNASCAGPNIGNYQASTTPYAGSAWYTWTAPFDGVVDLTSCAGGTDTRVWIYQGDCSSLMESLTLIAADDDGCAPSSTIVDWAVTGGETYIIEWDDEFDNTPFLWRIDYTDAVNYTFTVDMALETVDPGGVFITGSFTGGADVLMDDNGDDTWSATLAVPSNATIEYNYKNGATTETMDITIGDDCTNGAGNRSVATLDVDATLDAVCFGYCVSCAFVDIDEIALQEGVNIFPNPATDQLFIQFSLEESIDLEVRLINTLGQVVSNRIMNGVQSETVDFNVSQLPTGTYFIQLVNDDLTVSKKVVLQ